MTAKIVSPIHCRRLDELDALRGLAAMSVVFGHYFLLLATNTRTDSRLGWYFLYPNSAGRDAVILFFILSGFVLAIPAIEHRPQSYPAFIIRRVFRVYLPYLAALLIAVWGDFALHGPVTRSTWFHQFWSTSVDWSLVWRHVLFLGNYNTDQFDPPFWSLVYEMRLSIIFPALCALVLKLKPKQSLMLAGILSGASQFAVFLHPGYSKLAFADTLHYAALFVIGIYLARMHGHLCEVYERISGFDSVLIAIFAASLYIYGSTIANGILLGLGKINLDFLADWPTALGTAALIVLSSSSRYSHRLLRSKPILFLGKISYSVYLLHFLVMLVFIHLLYTRVPLPIILTFCLPVTIVASWIFYRSVEIPSIKLGRKLSEYIENTRKQSALPVRPREAFTLSRSDSHLDLRNG